MIAHIAKKAMYAPPAFGCGSAALRYLLPADHVWTIEEMLNKVI